MPKYGVEVISDVIVAVIDIAGDVKDSLPKIGLEDIGRIWSIIKKATGLFKTDWKQLVAEGRDLDQAETKRLGELVGGKLREKGIEVTNIDRLVENVLNILDNILEIFDLLRYAKQDDTTKANEPG